MFDYYAPKSFSFDRAFVSVGLVLGLVRRLQVRHLVSSGLEQHTGRSPVPSDRAKNRSNKMLDMYIRKNKMEKEDPKL